jgi:hypothetical protein
MKFRIRIRIRAGQNHGPPKKEKGKKSCLKSSLKTSLKPERIFRGLGEVVYTVVFNPKCFYK